jgi:hypothetical protein
MVYLAGDNNLDGAGVAELDQRTQQRRHRCGPWLCIRRCDQWSFSQVMGIAQRLPASGIVEGRFPMVLHRRPCAKLMDISFYLFTLFQKKWYIPFRNVAGYLLEIGANTAKRYKQKMASSSIS